MKIKSLKYLIGTALVAASLVGCSSNATNIQTYSATVQGRNGDLSVEVSMDGDRISNVEITSHEETEALVAEAIETLPRLIVENQTLELDALSGSTITSNAILDAVKKALVDGGVDVSKFEATTNEEATTKDTTSTEAQ